MNGLSLAYNVSAMSSGRLKTMNFQNMTNDNKEQKHSDSTEPAIDYTLLCVWCGFIAPTFD